jgi:hypothetical protein
MIHVLFISLSWAYMGGDNVHTDKQISLYGEENKFEQCVTISAWGQ